MNNAKEILDDARVYDEDTINIELQYPRNPGNISSFIIGLMDVRAADDIRVSYDFDRDGWKIEQQSEFVWSMNDPKRDPGWTEVAFVKAWQLCEE